ncbi:MAG: hypothetical protein ACYTG0_44970, partial [Planctomycetota bacterium]
MCRPKVYCFVITTTVVTLCFGSGCSRQPEGAPQAADGAWGDDTALGPWEEGAISGDLKIHYPLDETVFPPEIAAPLFRWADSHPRCNAWAIAFEFDEESDAMGFHSLIQAWTPSDEAWETIKRRSRGKQTKVTIRGVCQASAQEVLSKASLTVSTSPDEVGAPLFFREVNLPFATAVKDPAAHIRWRFGPISSKGPPPVVLENLPVCGNCHSFSADGSTLAMEVDSGNDKGSYAITPVKAHMVLDDSKVITWSDYRREDGELTFGLLCQTSPDGRYVVGTV